MTLATRDDEDIKAHKVILSNSSYIFQNYLMKHLHSNPLFYFNNLKSAEEKLLPKFIYLCQCEVGQEGLDDFLAAGIQLMIKGLVEEEEIIDQTSIKQNSYIDESSTKENHFYSDTDFMVDEKTDINSGCKLDEDKTQMNPIKPDIDI